MNLTLPTLIAGLRFALPLPASPRMPQAGPGAFWSAVLLSVAADFTINFIVIRDGTAYFEYGLPLSASWFVIALLLAWILTHVIVRPAWIWSLATWLLVASAVARLLACSIMIGMDDEVIDQGWAVFKGPSLIGGLFLVVFLAALRMLRWLEPRWHRARVAGTALATGLLFVIPYYDYGYRVSYFWSAGEEESGDTEEDAADPIAEALIAEDLFAEQDARVDAALAALAPQRPGHVDIFLVAFAGDGSEDVFRNEVHYVGDLFARRFDAAGHAVVLSNDASAVVDAPVASVRNLRRTLEGIGQRIDRDEDIVFLFLTSHGDEDHDFAIRIGDLWWLQQIDPDGLAAMIADAGLRWRVVAISACYSGGYVDALTSSTSLVMTAARKDRASFGCGVDSDITYFGQAYFAEALNETADFVAAFEIARDRIATREREAEHTPSEPQIATNPMIEAKLAEWRGGFTPGAPLPFVAPIRPASATAAAP
jgi:hypothetical protein